jgi:7,8-dihydropterin-6-yl-methyl-4-(beta-D-ribofuranosyl)aminobenzene 5'-phosphate synthase
MKPPKGKQWNPFARWGWRRGEDDQASVDTARTEPVRTASPPHNAFVVEAEPGPNAPGARRDAIWVTALVEDTVNGRELQAEHGLAFYIRSGGRCFLFDTGQSDLLLNNARTLSVDLKNVEAIGLSHGHYDHTGGLVTARNLAPKARLYLHPAALAPKFAGNPDGSSRSVGMAEASVQAVRHAGDLVVWTTRPTEVLDGIFMTGEIPRQNRFEDTGGRFFLDEDCGKPDPLLDDQALFFDTRDGLVIIVGCAHAGVVNTLSHVQQITGGRPIHAVVGGFHLLAASDERMAETLAALKNWGIQRIAAAHCTGTSAIVQLWTAFPSCCSSCAVGTRLAFRR